MSDKGNGRSLWDDAVDVAKNVCDWVRAIFSKKHNVLLTGFSRAGKTESYLALKDIAELDEHPNHSNRTTHGDREYPAIRIGGKRFALSDGGGHESRELQYEKYFKEAKEDVGAFTIVYVFDLERADSFWHSTTEKAKLQKEFDQLNRLASLNMPQNKVRFRMVLVGSHKDCFWLESSFEKARNDMERNLRSWIDDSLFNIVGVISADLKGSVGAKEFTKELVNLLDS